MNILKLGELDMKESMEEVECKKDVEEDEEDEAEEADAEAKAIGSIKLET